MNSYWNEFNNLCESLLKKGQCVTVDSLKDAQLCVNGLTDGCYNFLHQFEKAIRESDLSMEDAHLAAKLIEKLKQTLEKANGES